MENEGLVNPLVDRTRFACVKEGVARRIPGVLGLEALLFAKTSRPRNEISVCRCSGTKCGLRCHHMSCHDFVSLSLSSLSRRWQRELDVPWSAVEKMQARRQHIREERVNDTRHKGVFANVMRDHMFGCERLLTAAGCVSRVFTSVVIVEGVVSRNGSQMGNWYLAT